MSKKTKPIIFPYDSNTANQVILWFLHKHGGAMDKMKLVKLIFLADREHLFRYGRPIVGGEYCAMKYGPVPSKLLNDINKSSDSEKEYPFITQGHNVIAKASVEEEEFSQSELEILEKINSEYGNIDTFALSKLTHDLKAYKKNYPDETANTSRPLPYEDLFLDSEDSGMLDLIRDDMEVREFFS